MARPPKLNILFMGTPAFALPSLEALKKSEDTIVAVATQPDKPRGRGKRVAPSPVKLWALAAGIPVLQPKTARSASFIEQVSGLKPDVVLVVAYGKFLPQPILELPSFGCVNVHPSLLPKYRGAAPIQWALLNGEKETGVTTTLMTPQMDAGDILLQQAIPILPEDSYIILEEKLSRLAAQLVLETLAGLKHGTLTGRPQQAEEATLAPAIRKEDGFIHWEKSALAIERQVKALNPWPGTHTSLGGKLLKIRMALAGELISTCGEPGRILSVNQAGWRVACGQGELLVTQVQPENGKKMSAYDFSLGHQVRAGTLLGQTP